MRKLLTAVLALGWISLGTIAAAAAPKPADQPRTMEEVVDRIVVNENHLNQEIRKFSPLVETYIQNLRPDRELGFVPAGDKYFLGRADFSRGVNLVSLTDVDTKGKKFFSGIGNFFSFAMQYLPDGFLQMIFIDTNGFDKQHYKFDYVRREFLGEVRCLVFDVTPQDKAGKGRFLGRIWVEDQDYNIVRFNGAYGGGGHSSWYFHFDSWRTNVQPGQWMPSFVYSEERDLHYALAKKLDFKAQTRLWGYNVGHTIVLSRGLIDVLPDEASLATMIAHELGHVVLGHRLDSSYAFFDQLLIDDKETFRHFGFARTPDEERAANTKAMQILTNSPYKNQLGNAGLFLAALTTREKEIPNLISPHLGDRVPVIGDLRSSMPVDQKQNPQAIVALPIGGRVKLDSWNDKLDLIKSKPVGTVAEREKMPFEVTPFMPYLMRYGTETSKPIAASAAAPSDPKTGEAAPGKP